MRPAFAATAASRSALPARVTCAARSTASPASRASSLPAAASPFRPRLRGPNPGVALALGFIPGLGAVYNGEYLKALIHVFIFRRDDCGAEQRRLGRLPRFSRNCPRLLLFLHADRRVPCRQSATSRRAASRTLRRNGGNPCEGRKPVGAIILIALGAFFLLANLGLLEWDWFGKAWPLGLIVLGVWLLADRFKKSA